MADIATLMRYAAASPDTDTALMQLCMDAAIQWLRNAGVPDLTNNALYDLAVYQLATHYFDNRGVIADNGANTIPMGVMSIMHQLRTEPGGDTA